ncbi:MAG: type II/IV secretion system ATPase subunit [Candidatus Aenigmatarchaeota archaeon]
MELRKPIAKVRLGNIFRKAVKGNMNLKNRMSERVSQSAIPVSIEGITGLTGQLPELLHNLIIRSENLKADTFQKPNVASTPDTNTIRIRSPEVDISEINLAYILIPSGGDIPFAAANIKWSSKDSALIYYVMEPVLSRDESDLTEKIKTTLIEKLDVDFTTLRKDNARAYLKQKFEETINIMALNLPESKRQQILYFVERDFVGLGKLEPLMKDPNIEDISCDGIGIPLYIFHRNPLIGSIKTNVSFSTPEELDIFVNKIAQRCGKNVSVAQPLIGGTLPDGSRLQATLGTDIARKGSNFTIRKFTEKPMTPVDLVRFKTVDAKIAAFLWLAVEYNRSFLISGGTATGKTTILNALSLFIKPELKVVSIEDTAELLLPHPHWVPSVARTPIAEIEGRKLGEVDLFDLLRESLRQRPDYLIVGEVRGKEAYVLFQQMATGHASMATIHADSVERLMDRLTTPPISLPANLVEALDLIVFVTRIKYGQTYVRRVSSICEILGFDREKNFPIVNEIFRWNASSDTFQMMNPPMVLKKITQQFGISDRILQKEISNRMKVMQWMTDSGVEDFMDVAKIIKLYYSSPEDVMSAI